MINIKTIERDIKQEVLRLTCEKYGVKGNEVKVCFKSTGELTVTITPNEFVESLGINYCVTKEEN